MPSAVRAFGLSLNCFGPDLTTSRTMISEHSQFSISHLRKCSALSISAEMVAALANREASDR
jgi:hypothetical protein